MKILRSIFMGILFPIMLPVVSISLGYLIYRYEYIGITLLICGYCIFAIIMSIILGQLWYEANEK